MQSIDLSLLECAAKSGMDYPTMRNFFHLPHDRKIQKIYKTLLSGGEVIYLGDVVGLKKKEAA